MTGTIAGYLAALDVMVHEDFYDNSDKRCLIGWHGRDCSCFCNFGLANAGYPGIGLCNNSFANKRICLAAARPDFFVAKFGPGQGTIITKDQAMTVTCWGFEDTGGGHQETILGKPGGSTRSVGAHSHRTGIGYDDNGINNHNLQSFAVPPWFLPEMALAVNDPATVAALAKLDAWLKRVVAHPLRFGDRGPDVQIMIDLLRLHHFVRADVAGDAYGRVAQKGVYRLKLAHDVGNTDGKSFGGPAALTLLHL